MRLADANLWSGFHWRKAIPRLVITLRPQYWSLPLSICAGGHVIMRRGFTVGIGPIYFSWSFV